MFSQNENWVSIFNSALSVRTENLVFSEKKRFERKSCSIMTLECL
jgi:hypothetical protein